jgi:protocatechuate 3,4-dioxygenase beta subunit
MDNDDLPVGRLLTRRDALRLIAGATAVAGAGRWYAFAAPLEGATVPACVAKPELTEGPYFVDEKLERSDIRGEPGGGALTPGVPLALSFAVSRLANNTCSPLAGALVDVWQCDAQGAYSDVNDPGFNTAGKKFLRGFQRTDNDGVARFTTVYPGWYRGRTVHIHFKIRTTAPSNAAYEFTSQVFFDDAFSDRLFAEQPAYKRPGKRDTLNGDDFIFRESRGQLLLPVTTTTKGLTAALDVALDLSNVEVGRPDGEGGRGRRGGRRGGRPPGSP